ncbi:MAG TPA: hypothetical protein VIT67_16860 [Povalibacter sp.]|jgi:hypothetical protein
MTRILLAATCALLGACTTVKLNHDNTTSITHDGGAEKGKELATLACQKAGESSAVIVSTVNADSQSPPGTGRQVTTFRCTSDAAAKPAAQ